MRPATSASSDDVAGLDREHAATGHGVPRVDRKVEDRIIDIAGIGQGLARVGRQSQRDGHLLAERSPQQLNRARDAIIEIQSLEPDLLPVRKDEQPAGEVGTHLDCIHRVLDHIADLLVSAAKRDRIQVGGDGRQHIVEVVRNAASKLADCFHALRLRQRCLCLLAQRHLTLKIGEGRHERLVRVCPLNRRTVERVLQVQDLRRSGRNRLARFRGHVGKRLAQLIDRLSDLSGQAPGEQEARCRKASAQHDRPAHRIPSRRLQLRFLDCDAPPSSYLSMDCALAAMRGSPSMEAYSNNPG